MGSKKDKQETKINPLTGLPENLEEKAYRAITSIESVSDQRPLQQAPAVTVVDLTRAAARRRHRIGEGRGGNLINRQLDATAIKPSTKTEMSSLMAGTLGSNFDSIKSFLEADDIIRNKLNNEFNNKFGQQ